MLTKLKQWLAGSDEENAELAANLRQKVIFNLKKLQREHCFVDVRFPGRDDTVFQSLILEVDHDSNLLTIDELYPASDVGDVTAGEVVEITSRKKGIRLSFTTHIEMIDYDDGAPLYQLEIPASLKAKQQRRYFRIQVQPDSDIRLNIFDEAGLMCTVLNLSNNGIGFYVSGNHSEALRQKDHLRDCILKLPEKISINCGIDLRSVEFKKHPNRRTLVGGAFRNISQTDLKKLESFIASVQRTERKKESRF